MSSKPFPFPLGIGVDLCNINRIAALLRQEHVRNRWAQKVFSRLEWVGLCRRMNQANAVDEKTLKRARKEWTDTTLTLPKLSNQSSILEDNDESRYWSTIADERSRLGDLMRFFAGRWAAKEAAIKAHRHRRLYMQDISIVKLSAESKPVALIDPVCSIVQMDEQVAASRGLRGFGKKREELPKGSLDDDEAVQQPKQTKAGTFTRRRKVKMTERQMAEINISHDGDYAVAVCMALDSPGSNPEGRLIVDDGTGEAVHEPQWGDEGWLDPEKERGAPTSPTIRKHGVRGTSTFGKAFEVQDDWRIPQLP